jgi:hypothetical protein
MTLLPTNSKSPGHASSGLNHGSPRRRLRIAAGALFTAMLFSSNALFASTNVLANPGFETGTLSSWTGYGNSLVESTNNTYYNGGSGVGASNVLTHSGTRVSKTYGQFQSYTTTSGFYQDGVAAPGSIWSAQGWALTHHQDQMGVPNTAWIEVRFLDSSHNPTTGTLALYKSATIDPTSLDFTPDIWVNLKVTNQVDIADSTTVTNTVSSFTAPAGTSYVRYQFVFLQVGGTYAGGSLYVDDTDLEKIAGSDPDITASPASATKVVGQSVSLTVSATGGTTLHYQWRKDGVNLSNGGNVSGATTATLTLANLAIADSGSYDVVINDNNGTLTSGAATLSVLTADQAANALSNPGFETGSFSSWSTFNGNAIHTTNDNYFLTATPIDVYDGTYVSQIYNAGEYDGFFQDIPAAPGSVWTADGWGLTPTADQIAGASTCWIEVTFRNNTGGIISISKSAVIDTNTTPSTWIYLPVTNQVSLADNSVIGTSKYLVAPDGTVSVRYQTTYHALSGGSVLFDDLRLLQKIPVTITPSLSGGNMRITFTTRGAATYAVIYKNNLTDANWTTLTTVTGDGSVKTVTDAATGAHRFYQVITQ